MNAAQDETFDLLRDLADDALRTLAGVTDQPHMPFVTREYVFQLIDGRVVPEVRWKVGFVLGDVLDAESITAWGIDPELSQALAMCVSDFQQKWSARLRRAREVLSVA